jgi:hypothetical protein
MAERATETLQALRGQASTLAREIVDLAAARALAGTEQAKKGGVRVRRLQRRANEEVVPSIREVALNAASAALDLWQVAREKASDAIEAADSGRDSAAHLLAGAEHAAKDAANSAKDAAHTATAQLALTGRKAKEVSAHAAEATVANTKDGAAAFVWGGAAAAIVFYLMLDDKRRNQVLHAVDSIVKTSIDLIHDFRGYDEEFA